jgi:hypothetical protein
MQLCPQCKSTNIHRSQSHSRFERPRKRFTTERLFRCHECGWRGWGEKFDHGETRALVEPVEPLDLDAIDRAVTRRREEAALRRLES